MLRRCLDCPTLTHRPRCHVHARTYDRQRGTAHQRGYTYAWSTYSKGRLTRLPWCGQQEDGSFSGEYSQCVRAGLQVPAEVTDHIVPTHMGGEFWEAKNHLSLCRACNTAKANMFERKQ